MDFGFYTINLNLNWLPPLETMSPLETVWWAFSSIGWLGFLFFFFWVAKVYWLEWRQNKFLATVEWSVLAIDVPRENEQTPKAVEHIFNQIWGIVGEPSPKEKWLGGQLSLAFSLEIVSIEGYIQYIVRTPKQFKDIVEAAFYAQYPDSEVTEIRDYTEDFTPENFREKGYNLWGAQIGLVNDQYYPIRTYPMFEHTLMQKIADPLAAILELFSKLGPGEQLWFQIVIKPADDAWKDEAEKVINKLLGIKEAWKKNLFDKILDVPIVAMEKTVDSWMGRPPSEAADASSTAAQFLNMPPHKQDAVKAIALKATKTGFKTKMRMIYIAKNEVMGKAKVVPTFFGALKQFAALNSNGFKPSKGTATSFKGWFEFSNRRKLKDAQDTILKNYKSRTMWGGKGSGEILNTEELASLYHFPGIDLKAPTLQQVAAKKAEAPAALPTEIASPFINLKQQPVKPTLEAVMPETVGAPIDISEKTFVPDSPIRSVRQEPKSEVKSTKAEPPSNLPFA